MSNTDSRWTEAPRRDRFLRCVTQLWVYREPRTSGCVWAPSMKSRINQSSSEVQTALVRIQFVWILKEWLAESLLELLFFCSVAHAQSARLDVVHRFIVEEGSDVTLLCSLGNDDSIEKMVFDWKKTDQEVFLYARGVHYNKGITGQDEQFRGRVSHFPEELKNGNASIVIRNTVLADSGNYTCIFPDFEPHRRFDVELVVRECFHKET
ncbi:myelin-oligodendrocyte glycoprotein-like [Stegastes partitus]|uniref:Myelin-oligodendrocyte glycoprotein-like n=1 Tax=Stegastes partitus TaxID=144197 RepID=A0A9Y4JM01_9TELE|nr:PREDICTED: myelin-oligodendrocyte glycoprotein-like [Stegastes partitus]